MYATIVLIAAAVGLLYLFFTWNFDYWKKRGLPGPKPQLLVGNYPNVLTQKKHISYDIDNIYRAYKNDEDFVGVYNFRMPQLLVLSPTLVRQVLVNDFRHFHDNEVSTMVDGNSDKLFGNNIFNLIGEKWKERRALLTPALTLSRIKAVYPVTNQVCKRLKDYIKEQIRIAPKDGTDAKDLSFRFTSEVVTDCVLGLQAGSFTKQPTPILGMIKGLFDISFGLIFYMLITNLLPSLKLIFKTRLIPKNVEIFFIDLMQKAVDLRKSQNEQIERADFLDYLLQLQKKKNITTTDLTIYSMTFLLDGFETSAAVLAHCLLFLGRYVEVQERLRTEILKHLNEDGIIDFETLAELPYLDACIHETLRFYPPGFSSNKLCTEPITLKSKNGRSIHVERGMVVVLPFYSIMMDEDYYANPQTFQPERFLPPNGREVKEYRENGLYYGFSDGPRVCIGMRFALTQIKAALVEILQNFNVNINKKTREDNFLDPKAFFPHLKDGIWLNFEAR